MKIAFSRSEPVDLAIKTAMFGTAWLVVGVLFFLYAVGNPISDLRLALWATTVHGKVLAAEEEPQDQDAGGVRWSSDITYSFMLPNGREIESAYHGDGRIPAEWAKEKLPVAVEVEYLSSGSQVNRLKAVGSHTVWEWIWRTSLGLFLLSLWTVPGVRIVRDAAGVLGRGYDLNDDPLWWPTSECPAAEAFILKAVKETDDSGLTGLDSTVVVSEKARTFALAHVPGCPVCREHRENVRSENRRGNIGS